MENLSPELKLKIALELIDQIIIMERARDREMCQLYHKLHKDTKTVGESQILTSLNALKELLV